MEPDRTIADLLEQSLERVWNERDDTKRRIALEELYHAEAVLFEPDNRVAGIDAISNTVAKTLSELPDGFRFRAIGRPSGHHGLGLARWEGGPDGRVIVTGSDVVKVADGRIAELYVLFDTPAD